MTAIAHGILALNKKILEELPSNGMTNRLWEATDGLLHKLKGFEGKLGAYGKPFALERFLGQIISLPAFIIYFIVEGKIEDKRAALIKAQEALIQVQKDRERLEEQAAALRSEKEKTHELEMEDFIAEGKEQEDILKIERVIKNEEVVESRKIDNQRIVKLGKNFILILYLGYNQPGSTNVRMELFSVQANGKFKRLAQIRSLGGQRRLVAVAKRAIQEQKLKQEAKEAAKAEKERQRLLIQSVLKTKSM